MKAIVSSFSTSIPVAQELKTTFEMIPLVPLLNLIAWFSAKLATAAVLPGPTRLKFVIVGLAIGVKAYPNSKLSASIPLFPFPKSNFPYQLVFVTDRD